MARRGGGGGGGGGGGEAAAARRRRGGGARGARGGGEPAASVSTAGMVRTSARLVAGEWPWFAVAFVCLAINCASNLTLPSYQGLILDSVIGQHRARFRNQIVLYVSFSVFTAVSGAVRALCFQTAGRRIAYTMRTRVFAALVTQDIEYYDRTTSGKLVSLLTRRARARFARFSRATTTPSETRR